MDSQNVGSGETHGDQTCPLKRLALHTADWRPGATDRVRRWRHAGRCAAAVRRQGAARLLQSGRGDQGEASGLLALALRRAR